jgi:protein-tyrosine-phosphatase
MSGKVYNVLFLCTGNSARSILAEALLPRWGAGRFRAFSAGSQPRGEVHPMALETLRDNDHPTEGFRSKSWDEFASPGAPDMDFVFTVCGNAAQEACPTWPGQPVSAHWGVDDPAAVEGTDEEKRRAFRRAYLELEGRIKVFASLPIETLELVTLQKRLDEIGRTPSLPGA